MKLTLTEDQLDLRSGLRDYLRKAWTADRLREGISFDPGAWKELAGLGVFEELELTDRVVVFEELGRALVPGPLVATAVAGIDGVVTVCDTAAAPVVEHAAAATHLAILGDGLSIVPNDFAYTEKHPMDPLTPVSWLSDPPAAPAEGDGASFRRTSLVLAAAQSVGVAQGALDLATAYAKQREQFGRPIGSFQAVKHLLADMLVRTELARSAVWSAAADPTDRAVASASILASEAATTNGRSGIQVHGGMGFTWEVLAHLYAKRAWVLATAFGTVDGHHERVAAALG